MKPLIDALYTLLIGRYIRIREENYGSFLRKIGVVSLVRRNAILSSIESSGIIRELDTTENGVWKLTTTTGSRIMKMEFRIGIPFFQMFAGNKYKTTVTLDRNTMKSDCTSTETGKKSFKIIRKFTGKGFESHITCEDVVCTEYFERQ